MSRERVGALVLAVAAVGLALVREQLAADHAAGLAVGTALLGFWGAAALRVGRAVAARMNAEAPPASRALDTFLYAYLFVLLCMAAAGALHRIDGLALTGMAAAAFLISPRPARANIPGPPAQTPGFGLALIRRHPLASAIVGAAGAVTVANAAWAFVLPPFAHDDLTYHLVFPVEWMQSGTLNMRAVPFGNHSPAYYPKNTELFYLWLLLPLRQAFPINAAQLVFLVVSVLALLEIFRLCGASVRASLVGASLFCICPVVVAELARAYVDVAFACFFLLAFHAVLLFREAPSAAKAMQFAAAVGLFAGTKMPGLVLATLILLPSFGVVWLLSPARKAVSLRTNHLVLGGLAGGLIFLLAGGWWYVRNLVVTGNPVFPLHVELLGMTLFGGAYGRSALPGSQWETLLELFSPWLGALFGVGALYTAASALTTSQPLARRSLLVGLVLPGLLALVFGLLLPFDYARFVLALCGLAAAVLMDPLDSRRRWVRRTTELSILAALLACLATEMGRHQLLLPLGMRQLVSNRVVESAFVLTCSLLLVSPLLAVRMRPARRRIVGACVAVLAWLSLHAAALVSDCDGTHLIRGTRNVRDPYIFLDQNYRRVTVAATGSNKTFWLYGRDFSNRVRYVNVNQGRDWLFHDHVRNFPDDPTPLRQDRNGVGYYRRDSDYNSWLANLQAAGADLLVVSRLTHYNLKKDYLRDGRGYPLEAIWAHQHPEKFRRVYEARGVRIYEVLN